MSQILYLLYPIGILATLYTLTEFIIYQPLYQIVKGEENSKRYALSGTAIIVAGFTTIFLLLNYIFQFQSPYNLGGVGLGMFLPIYPLITLLVVIAVLFLTIQKIRRYRQRSDQEKNTPKIFISITIYFGAILANAFVWISLYSLSNAFP